MGVNRLWTAVEPTVSQCALDEFIISEGFHPCNINGTPQLMHIGFDASLWMHAVCSVFMYNHTSAGQNSSMESMSRMHPISLFNAFKNYFLPLDLPGNAVFLDDSDILLFGAPCM
ncbi:hypothetical protein J3A83DRAFT_4259771, partial [Scleroderma citrinum]